jgi:hypothetical protein
VIRDRDLRRLQHTKAANTPLASSVPAVGELAEGEGRIAMVNGKAVQYQKVQGQLFHWPGMTEAMNPAIVATNGTTQRSYDASSTSIDELADVVATLIADLRSQGLIR